VNRAARSTVEEAFDPRRNSFGFVRLAAALTVIISHAFALGGFGREPLAAATAGQADLGSLAVAVFFVVSGFLITRSFIGRSSTARYAWHRVLRIIPGYWTCLLVSAFGFGLVDYWATHGSLTGFLGLHAMATGFVVGNLNVNFHHDVIRGVFVHNPEQYLNGSLWTLIYEVRAYILVIILGLLGCFRRYRFVLVGCIVILWGLLAFDRSFPSLPLISLADVQFQRLTLYFLLGAAAFVFGEHVRLSPTVAAVCGAVLVGGVALHRYESIEFLPVAYLVIYIATQTRFATINVRTDLSYGTYVYAWPVQQTFVALGTNHWGVVPYLGAVVVSTLGLAWLSWTLVESPMLKLKKIRLHRLSAWASDTRRRPVAAD
jgi:peptidoglycan/LPS O-acetylase OafA/YrhL